MLNLPLVQEMKSYSWDSFRGDFVAALTVAVVLVPQGMAYALLAGLPPVYGLYAGLVPLFVYPWFASSKTLSIGPVALMSILLLSSLTIYAEPGSDKYISLVLLTGLMAGIFQLVFGVLQLGFISNFLSRPVMTGFVSAAGVIIAVSQIKYFFTLDVPRSSSIVQMLWDDAMAYSSANSSSFILGTASVILILALKKWSKRIPRYLVAVILGTVVLYLLNLDQKGVPIVGELQAGLPALTTQFLVFNDVLSMIPIAFLIAVICFIGSYSIAETMESSTPGSVSADQELISLGLSKIVGSFFLAFPATGSFTRSVVNEEAGAVSGMAGIYTGIFIALTLLLAGPLFYYLPEPVLAAIVITSVFSLIKYSEAKRLWNLDRRDFWVFLVTFISTLVLGIVNGVVAGIVLSLLSIIHRSSRPHFAELGRLPGTHSFRNIRRYPQAEVSNTHLILRYDQDLFFGNGAHFYKSLIKELERRSEVDHMVLHLGAIHHMDSTALQRVWDLIGYCEFEDIELIFTNLSGPIRDKFEKAGIYQKLGEGHFHLNVAQAVLHDDSVQIDKELSKKLAHQREGS